ESRPPPPRSPATPAARCAAGRSCPARFPRPARPDWPSPRCVRSGCNRERVFPASEDFQHRFRRTADAGLAAGDHDRPLQKYRVLGHGAEQFVLAGIGAEAELAIDILIAADHVVRPDAELLRQLAQGLLAGRRVEVADDLGFESAL